MRRFLDVLTRAITWTRRNQVVKPDRNSARLNLGSGLTVAEGWINVDSSLNALASRLPRPLLRLSYKLSNAHRWYSFPEYADLLKTHTFVHHDLTYGIPLADNSVAYIYSAHFFEHLHRRDTEHLFREARRVLVIGGTFRINVPNFEDVIERYQRGDTEGVLNDLFAKPGAEHWYNRHRYVYDFKLLARLLKEAGFSEVERCESGVGSLPSLDVFEGRRSARGLYVEAKAT